MKSFMGKQVTIFIDSIYVQGLMFEISEGWVKLVDLENKMNLIKVEKISLIKESAVEVNFQQNMKNNIKVRLDTGNFYPAQEETNDFVPRMNDSTNCGSRMNDSTNIPISNDYVSQFDLLRNK